MAKPTTSGVANSVGRTAGADATEATNRASPRGEEGDAVWFRRLSTGNSAARAFQNHLASIESRVATNGTEAAIGQAIRNREAFLAALHHSCSTGAPYPCGLAQRVPRYVAIVNLSGTRLLLTSDNDVLIRALCARSSRSTPRELAEKLHRFVLWVEANNAVAGAPPSSAAFVFATYSLPWQAGLSSAYWELNTVSITAREDGVRMVLDRHVSFSSLSEDTFTARPTLSTRGIDEAQRAAFAVEYLAVNLDARDDETRTCEARVTDDEGINGGGSTVAAAENLRLRSLVVATRAETSRDREEIRNLQATLRIRGLLHAKAVARARLAAAKAVDEAEARVADANAERDRLRCTSQKLLVEQADATKLAGEAQRRLEKLRKQEISKDRLHNAATAKQGDELRRLADRLEASKRAAAEQLEEARRAHEREREGLVARAAHDRGTLQEALHFKERALNQLAEINDVRLLDLEAARAELARATAELAARDVEAHALRTELAAAEGATDALRTELAAAAEATVVATTTATTTASTTTESRGTTTHHHSTTQTSDARVVAEDLPESMRAAMTAVPHAMTAAPVVMAAAPPMCPHAPSGFPRPFGTPQTTMGAVRFHLANLMNWTAYLENELAQVAAAQCEPQPFYAPPQHRRGRTAR